MVSHLLFVDVLIFSLRRTWIRFCIWGVFIWFEDVSGLKVNLGKLELVPVGDVHNLEELANLMGCKASHIPMKYPGLPLGAKFTANTLWNTILDKMERRLAWWKWLYLSEGRRITLIKSTLSNLPTYFLLFFPILVNVLNHIEKLQQDFLWRGLGEESKFHIVKWNKIWERLQSGGLTIRNPKLFNQVLWGKWLWRFDMERGFVEEGNREKTWKFVGRMVYYCC